MDFRRIEEKKKLLDSKRPLPEALVKNLKEHLLVEWTYHSNAIEGNTLTLSETKVVLEGITVGGKSLREHFEVINHAEAIVLIEELISKDTRISEFVIKQIHQLILKNIREREAGAYRTVNVFIQGSPHIPPMNSLVPGLMRDLLEWLDNEGKTLHPVERAATFHHRFVHIHPFIDGNGRTARLLMNLILMQDHYPPAIIRQEDRSNYYNALRGADETGNVEPLVLLVSEAVERMLDSYLWALGLSDKRS
ncbi:Fic family protein [Fodinisporobacter ferrooxydans]|uniref:Fic family protein n=1 Tax=Fodinisporobacter ferrooxydans TaxID=2901836 RepID=A0ABY4CRX6_9BACL|nr:Fic family protein [Alicyclobacillaceae bacterium MYW30-H2]